MTPFPSAPSQAQTWSNWSGLYTCQPRRWQSAASEAEIQDAVTRAAAEGATLRATGARHSFSPIVITNDVILDVYVSGEPRVEGACATIPAGQRLCEFLDPLWANGLALSNMGELDSTTLAGAVATGVHGTGLELPSISASVRSLRLVTADGSVVEASSTGDQQLFRAAKQSVGLLGVVSELTIELLPAYDLVEESFFLSPDEALERWDELLQGHRHFSFFYLPSPAASHTYVDLVPEVPSHLTRTCYATVRDTAPPDGQPPQAASAGRRDRVHRILAYEYHTQYREIEFAVPLDEAKQVFRKISDLLTDWFPDYAHPVDVRFVAQDDALLSWSYDGPKAIFSVPESINAGFEPVLGVMERLFVSHGGLPHWGKEHTMNIETLRNRQPGLTQFLDVRRELDPNATFLNPYLQPYFT